MPQQCGAMPVSERRPAGRTGRRRTERLAEEHALVGEALQVGRSDGVAVRLDVATGVVGVDVEDVGARHGGHGNNGGNTGGNTGGSHGVARLTVGRDGQRRLDKRDEPGRSIDARALRTTFGTHLSRGGVPLRTAQAAMRHSDPRLTADVYTDPKLLDVMGALDALPVLPLVFHPQANAAKQTGADATAPLVAVLVPTTGPSGQNVTVVDSLVLV